MRDAVHEHFDAVVVGSGFGGAVMAYRLADAGLRVCLLERGKEYPPGSFARSPQQWKGNFWDPSEGLHGLFNVWSFRGLEAIVSSGLGGGSLIYANVLMRKPPEWFVREQPSGDGYEHWPVGYEQLEPHYDAVEKMLDARPYPYGEGPHATHKTRALKEAAEKLGLDWRPVRLAVTFGKPGERPGEPITGAVRSRHGNTRYTCDLCGECDIGCNKGSKNTLDQTYLSAIDSRYAVIRTRCEVRRFWPRRPRGFEVRYVVHEPSSEGRRSATRDLREHVVTADQLVLAAGTLGTSYLMLKNRDALPGLSPTLGSRFSGNGDLLAFAKKRRRARHAAGAPFDPTVGPVITGAIAVPDAVEGNGAAGRGFFIEDGGYPRFVGWMHELTEVGGVLSRGGRFLLRYLSGLARLTSDTDLGAELAELVGPAERSAATLPLLGMGRDVADGRLGLERGRLQLDWRVDRSRPYFDALRATMAQVAGALDARFGPSWLSYLHRVVTVHPLGGCPMGRSAAEGVVDGHGRVFGCPGLWIVDGAAMPGPVGSNPSLTIAAFAHRAAERLIHEQRPARAVAAPDFTRET